LNLPVLIPEMRQMNGWVARKERAQTYIKADCTADNEKDGRAKDLSQSRIRVFHPIERATFPNKFSQIRCIANQILGVNGKFHPFFSLLFLYNTYLFILLHVLCSLLFLLWYFKPIHSLFHSTVHFLLYFSPPWFAAVVNWGPKAKHAPLVPVSSLLS
jgi:hypothetical protein